MQSAQRALGLQELDAEAAPRLMRMLTMLTDTMVSISEVQGEPAERVTFWYVSSGVLPLLNYTPEEVCAWGCVPFTQLHSAAQCAAIKAAARLSQQPVSPSPDP